MVDAFHLSPDDLQLYFKTHMFSYYHYYYFFKPVKRGARNKNEAEVVCVSDLRFRRGLAICSLLTIYLQRGVTVAQC